MLSLLLFCKILLLDFRTYWRVTHTCGVLFDSHIWPQTTRSIMKSKKNQDGAKYCLHPNKNNYTFVFYRLLNMSPIVKGNKRSSLLGYPGNSQYVDFYVNVPKMWNGVCSHNVTVACIFTDALTSGKPSHYIAPWRWFSN